MTIYPYVKAQGREKSLFGWILFRELATHRELGILKEKYGTTNHKWAAMTRTPDDGYGWTDAHWFPTKREAISWANQYRA